MLNLKKIALPCALSFMVACSNDELPSQEGLDDFSVCVDNHAIEQGLRVDYNFFEDNADSFSRVVDAVSSNSPPDKLFESIKTCFEQHNVPKEQQEKTAINTAVQLALRGASPEQGKALKQILPH